MLWQPRYRSVYSHVTKVKARQSISWLRYNSTASELPSQTEKARSNLSKSLTSRLDRFQTSILFAGQRLNDLTGYSGIERLKQQIENQEQEVTNSVRRVRDAKKAYEEAIRTRSESQKEVNELLQRKSSWSSPDLERFTTLFRDDHSNSQREEAASKNLANMEAQSDQARTDLGNMILARYHEEQIWSDKIRRASTWGTWGLMCFNIFLFVIVQLGLEPWKRRRLVGSFEEKVRQVVQEERATSVVPPAVAAPNSLSDTEDFLTAADDANAGFDHQPNKASVVLDELQPGLTEATTKRQDHIGGVSIPEQDTSELDRPRVGSSSMMLSPFSLATLRHAISISFESLRMNTRTLFQNIQHLYHMALSSERSSLRTEDVTSACFASGALGIAVGILLSRG